MTNVVGVAIAFAVGLAWMKLKPDSHEEHRERVLQQFQLPHDVEFLEFKSGWSKGKSEFIDATIQLTPEQYSEFVAGMEDPKAFTPFEHRYVAMSEAEPGWNRWHEGDLAFFVVIETSRYREQILEEIPAMRDVPYKPVMWGNWGHVHRNPEHGDWNIFDKSEHKTLCWAYGEVDGKRAARSCTDYPPSQWRPEVYVRAKLYDESRRLFVAIH